MKSLILISGVVAADGPKALEENFICGTPNRIETVSYTVKEGDQAILDQLSTGPDKCLEICYDVRSFNDLTKNYCCNYEFTTVEEIEAGTATDAAVCNLYQNEPNEETPTEEQLVARK